MYTLPVEKLTAGMINKIVTIQVFSYDEDAEVKDDETPPIDRDSLITYTGVLKAFVIGPFGVSFLLEGAPVWGKVTDDNYVEYFLKSETEVKL